MCKDLETVNGAKIYEADIFITNVDTSVTPSVYMERFFHVRKNDFTFEPVLHAVVQ